MSTTSIATDWHPESRAPRMHVRRWADRGHGEVGGTSWVTCDSSHGNFEAVCVIVEHVWHLHRVTTIMLPLLNGKWWLRVNQGGRWQQKWNSWHCFWSIMMSGFKLVHAWNSVARFELQEQCRVYCACETCCWESESFVKPWYVIWISIPTFEPCDRCLYECKNVQDFPECCLNQSVSIYL